MGEKEANIYDVAEEAGVGIGTVSRVLNESQKVKQKTREKVQKAMNKLNYRPDAMARGLARQRTNSAAVLVPAFTEHFFVEVLRGVQKGLEKYEMDLVLYDVGSQEKKERHVSRVLNEKKVDGVLAIYTLSPETIASFKKADLPLVLINEAEEKIDSIFINDILGARKAVDHLLDLGHSDIAFLNGPLHSPHAVKRLKGVKKALSDSRLEIREDLLISGDLYPELTEESDFTEELGCEQMKKILGRPEKKQPTAIFAASDIQAIGALKAIEKEDLSVPEDYSLIGYDDIDLARHLNLTTISQPMFKMGEMGVDILMERITADSPYEDRKFISRKLEPELVIRNSCRKLN